MTPQPDSALQLQETVIDSEVDKLKCELLAVRGRLKGMSRTVLTVVGQIDRLLATFESQGT